jgi:hypothetical protein
MAAQPLPGYFFSTLQKNMFTSQFRRYPISFPYPFAEDDELTVDLPEGYEVEEPPYRRKAGLSYAGYEISFALEGHQLTAGRKLHLNGTQFPPKKYDELKNFFSIVQKGDEGHAVLQRGQNEKAENLN